MILKKELGVIQFRNKDPNNVVIVQLSLVNRMEY